MHLFARYLAGAMAVAMLAVWPAFAAENQPTPSRDDAERNAFHTPTTGQSGGGHDRQTNAPGDNHFGSHAPSSNPEGKNTTEPDASPSKASPNGPAK